MSRVFFNAVLTEGNFVDKTMMEGRGAGAGPTASSVVADIIDLAKGNGLPTFGVAAEFLKDLVWGNTDSLVNRCYIHMRVADEPGVLADITAYLKDENVSIDSFIQRGDRDDGTASVVIMTHEAPMATMKHAIEKIQELPSILDKPALLRVENM